MMAKRFLDGYTIGGDIIDRVSQEETLAPKSRTKEAADVVLNPVTLHQNSVEAIASAESPVGRTPLREAEGMDARETTTAGGQPHEVSPPEPPTIADPTPGEVPVTDEVPRITERTFTKDGLFHVFTLGSTTYRVGGVKPLFVTSLRVNIRATYEHQSYYDSLDLYNAKARVSYANSLNRAWGVESSRVERDLVQMLEQLEAERDEQLTCRVDKPRIELSPQDREMGLSLLRDPHLFDRIASDLTTLGYVGEDLNKQLLYLCASSRKLDDPISVMILSQSASGKSFLVDSVRKLIPPEDVVAVTSLSDQALNYLDDLMHKFLILGEAVHSDVVEHQIREMLSGKELSRMVAIKDPETGKLSSQIVRTPVIVASVMSGTNHRINPENASRCFIMNTDESKEQTVRIHTLQRQKYSLERLQDSASRVGRIIKTHHAAQRMLQPLAIVNEFAPLLDFPVNLMRLRRDHDRFLDLIACVCFVRQFQKKIEDTPTLRFIRADVDDYAIAYRIMVEGVLSSTVRELPKGVVGLYDELRSWAEHEGVRQGLLPTEVSFTQREVREITGLSHTWIQVGLRQLVDYEYVVLQKGGGPRSKGHYRLSGVDGIKAADLSMIPTPSVMKRLWEERS